MDNNLSIGTKRLVAAAEIKVQRCRRAVRLRESVREARKIGKSAFKKSSYLLVCRFLTYGKKADVVYIDEAIDELADFCGARKAVAEWTTRAIGASVAYEKALDDRLDRFKPSLPCN